MIIGHKTQWELLKKLAQGPKRPQALLFSGQDYLGKKLVALEFIKIINCTEENKPCGACLSCQLIEKQNHPDLIVILPEGKEIQIGQVRELQRSLSLKPQFFSEKAVIVDNAHTLNQEAQSCLLKTLEEPPGNAFFVLLTSRPAMLFSTIRSRCEVLKFYPVPEGELAEGFQERQSLPNFKGVIAQCHGRPGKAVAFFENEELLLEQEKRLKAIQMLLKSPLTGRFAFSKAFFVKDIPYQQVEIFFEDFIRYLRGLILEKLEIGRRASPKKDLDTYSIKQLKEVLSSTCDLKFLLESTNINQRLGFENLLINL